MCALNTLVFWLSLGLLKYTYVGYPVSILTLAKLRPKRVQRAPIAPSVSVLLPVRNGERYIDKKLENLLSMQYPQDKIEIIVVSDASTDATDEIVQSFRDRGVRFERLETPSGKAVALNRGAALATGEILVFCDVRQRIDAHAVAALVSCFADPAVGAASGELFFDSDKGPGLYWQYEKAIRYAESMVDSVPGATGAFYAIRRTLFETLPPELLLDDVFTPMQILLKGFRIVFEREAKAFDTEADHRSERQRKARTLAGNLQLLHYLPSILDPKQNRIFWQYTSHKLLRLASPFALTALLASNLTLVLTVPATSPFYAAALATQLSLLGFALNGAVKGDKSGTLSKAAHTFFTLNLAALEGAWRHLRHDYQWTR